MEEIKEINDHYTKVQSQELSKGRGEVMDKVCTGCGRLESQGSIGGTFLSCCPDRDYQEIGCNMKDLIVFYKSQAKEIEGLRDILRRVDNEFENLSNLDSPEIVSPNDKLWEEIGKLLSQGTTTQPDKGSVMPTETDNTELNKPLKGKS